MKILVVCRNQSFADCVACTLHSAGHKAIPLCSLADARTHAHYLDFELAILILPPPYCQRLGHQLQALRPKCRILLMHTDEIAESEREGFEFLQRTFRSRKLIEKVGEIQTAETIALLGIPLETDLEM